jgi:hypothetical protein
MRITSILAATGIAALVVVTVDVSTYAASGHSFILGRSNAANSQTTLTRTTSGPTLALNSTAGQPGLKVNRTTRIPNLNADLVDGLQGAQIATRRAPLLYKVATPLPGRTVTVTPASATVQEVTFPVAAECGANTRHVYLVEQSAWASGTGTFRQSIDVDSAGVQFGPGFTLTSSTGYASMASARKIVLAPGTHTVRTVGDILSGSGSIGDPSLTVTGVGYSCAGGAVTTRLHHTSGRSVTGR